MIQFATIIVLVLMGFYYLTVFLHLFGVKMFEEEEISIGHALIPFFYWFKRKVVK